MKNFKKIIECRAEELDWSVKWYEDVEEDTCVEFSKYSPAGEDFSFEVWYSHVSEIPEKVMEYYEEFDPEYHASLWADSAGRNGVPRLRELLEDADAIEDTIRELANALKEENYDVEFDDIDLGDLDYSIDSIDEYCDEEPPSWASHYDVTE